MSVKCQERTHAAQQTQWEFAQLLDHLVGALLEKPRHLETAERAFVYGDCSMGSKR